jgi:PKHD-type hydroxylase C-terminal domain
VYLATKQIRGRPHYFIRETYPHQNRFLSRNLFDLGTDPGRYIVYAGGNSFYIHESVQERLNALNINPKVYELEDIFWRFLDPGIRRALEPFRNRQKNLKHEKAQKSKNTVSKTYHIFDRRRILYLRCGRTNQRNIGCVPQKLFRILADKSRDEIEQKFMEMEKIIDGREYKTYTYVIFNLQDFFTQWFAQTAPKMLDQRAVDEHFLEEICRLNSDNLYWNGMQTDGVLHEYLVRYLVMYFDYDYAPQSFVEEYIRNFINRHKNYRPVFKFRESDLTNAGALFKATPEALKQMGRKDLIRLYRKRIQKLHPDKGGDHDAFIRLTRVYHDLLRTKT